MSYVPYLSEEERELLRKYFKELDKTGGMKEDPPIYVKNDDDLIMGVELNSIEKEKATITNLFRYYNSKLEASPINGIHTVGTIVRSLDKAGRRVTSIILGYKHNNKIYSAMSELISTITGYKTKVEFSIGNIDYLIKDFDGTTFTQVRVAPASHVGRALDDSTTIKDFIQAFKIKVADSTLSARVFGLATVKSKIVGDLVKGVNIEFGKVSKTGQDTYYATIPIPQDSTESRKVKFCLADLEIIIPTIKGYNIPKDKTIRVGNLVKPINTKGSKLEYSKQYTVIAIKPNQSSKRISARSENKKLDVITLANGSNTYNCYAKTLKLI